MNHSIPGIELTFERDAGTCLMYRFSFTKGCEAENLLSLAKGLTPKQEISIPDPDNGDCSLELRNHEGHLEVKRGCHGSHGTWREVSLNTACQWLLPGAIFAAKNLRLGYGGVLVVHK